MKFRANAKKFRLELNRLDVKTVKGDVYKDVFIEANHEENKVIAYAAYSGGEYGTYTVKKVFDDVEVFESGLIGVSKESLSDFPKEDCIMEFSVGNEKQIVISNAENSLTKHHIDIKVCQMVDFPIHKSTDFEKISEMKTSSCIDIFERLFDFTHLRKKSDVGGNLLLEYFALDFKNRKIYGCDGYKLAVKNMDKDHEISFLKDHAFVNTKTLIHNSSVKFLKKIFNKSKEKNIELLLNSSTIMFKTNNTEFTTAVRLDNNALNIESFLEEFASNENIAHYDQDELEMFFKKSVEVAKANTNCFTFVLKKSNTEMAAVTLSTNTEISKIFNGNYNKVDDEIFKCFNPRFLYSAIKTIQDIDGKVCFQLGEFKNTTGCYFKNERDGYFAMVLPIRTDKTYSELIKYF